MDRPSFPIYRKLVNGQAFFRIASETRFTEVQLVGTRYRVHEIVAHTYPERLRIADLLGAGDGWVEASTAEEFEHWLSQAKA